MRVHDIDGSDRIHAIFGYGGKRSFRY